MKRFAKYISLGLAILIAALVLLGRPSLVDGVTLAEAEAPDPVDKPLQLRIWYPSNLAAAGNEVQTRHPLIVISHGTGGSNSGHSDTAEALASAGYIVAAVNHTGDNARDLSYVSQGNHLVRRADHIARTIDFMLDQWPLHGQIDQTRIGMFGHSAGGFTALVVAGGQPDMTRGPERCRKRPDAWDCQYVKGLGLDLEKNAPPPDEAWFHDERVKAAVIAAPAVGYAFEPDRLENVKIPIQLWSAGQDEIVEDSPEIVAGLLADRAEIHGVPDAGHFSFLSPCTTTMRAIIAVMGLTGTPAICYDPGDFDRADFHKSFNASVIAFFQKTLK